MIKKYIQLYIAKTWIPSFLLAATLSAILIPFYMQLSLGDMYIVYLIALSIILLIGIILAAIIHFTKKRWLGGFINSISAIVLGLPLMFIVLLVYSFAMSAYDDGFADNLYIPDNIKITKPLDLNGYHLYDAIPSSQDSFQHEVIGSLTKTGNKDTHVYASLPSLVHLSDENPELLEQYLASAPFWRLYKERGNSFATRRMMKNEKWIYTLNGYYSDFFDKNFQFRFTLGLSGKTWARWGKKATYLKNGEQKEIILSTSNQLHESIVLIDTGSIIVEIFEQSDNEERRLTKAALMFLEQEMNDILSGRHDFAQYSEKKDENTFNLINASQPGIYDFELWVNPKEAGMIYLKAFEVTQGTALSFRRLKKSTLERVGWSDNAEELFYANSHLTIYEGDWGMPYAARFEVWFIPDSGETEYKILEKVFQIEGWQR